MQKLRLISSNTHLLQSICRIHWNSLCSSARNKQFIKVLSCILSASTGKSPKARTWSRTLFLNIQHVWLAYFIGLWSRLCSVLRIAELKGPKKNPKKSKKPHSITYVHVQKGGNNMPVEILSGGALAGFEVSGQPCFNSTLCLPLHVPAGSSQFCVCEKCIVRALRQWPLVHHLQEDDVDCCDTPFAHMETERLVTVPRLWGQSGGHERPSCSFVLSNTFQTSPSLYFQSTFRKQNLNLEARSRYSGEENS